MEKAIESGFIRYCGYFLTPVGVVLLLLNFGFAQVEVRSLSGKVQVMAPKPPDSISVFNVVRGQILSGNDKAPLQGVTVLLLGTKLGSFTNLNGEFSIAGVSPGKYKLQVSYLGHITDTIDVVAGVGVTTISPKQIIENDIGLNEVKVIANYAKVGVTPVTITEISQQEIEEKLTSAQGFPEVLRFSPGIYVSQAGGGYGDLRVNVRGFDQENTAVLLNGIPINDMEFGKVYWVNWQNLSDVTRSFQVQHGLGVSKLAVNSVGGTMNIITRTTDMQAGGAVSLEVSTFAERKGATLSPYLYTGRFMFSTGRLPGGRAFTLQGVRTTGPGYLQNSAIDFWGYFMSFSQEIGTRHMLVFTAFGSPQKHNENFQTPAVPISVFEQQGNRFNPNWGTLNGNVISGQNFYHKPQLAVNHYFSISDRTSLNSSLYFSPGVGGGTAFSQGPRTPSGQWDLDAMYQANRSAPDTTFVDNNGQTHVGKNAKFYTSDFLLDQYWIGLLSTLTHKTSKDLNFLVGTDLRFYRGDQYFQVNNLLGADFLIDNANINAKPVAAKTGDKIFQNKTAFINWYGLFAQVEFTRNRFSYFTSISTVVTSYQRSDYFQYSNNNVTSGSKIIPAYSAKAGVTFRVNSAHRVYANAGYFTRAPFFGNVYPFSNTAENLPLEKVLASELGYNFNNGSFQANLAAYYIQINDKTQNFERLTDPSDGSEFSALVNGINARHMGLELRANYQINSHWYAGVFANLADWQYINDTKALKSNPQRNAFAEFPIYINHLHVGNAPQTAVGWNITYRPTHNFNVILDWVYYERLYANLSNGRTDPNNKNKSWQLPAYALMNANVSYTIEVGNISTILHAQVQNVFDRTYYPEGVDGVNNDSATSFVFAGFGRILTLGITLRW